MSAWYAANLLHHIVSGGDDELTGVYLRLGGVQATIGSLDTNGCKPLSPASRFSGATLSTL
jgi:hypothetical protein